MTVNGLRLLIYDVRSAGFSSENRLEEGRLEVSEEAARECMGDPALASVHLSWVAPGSSTRIVKVLDAVQPRTKGPGGAGIFPGTLSAAVPQGRGETHALSGVAVVAAGHLPRAQEALVEMSGPAAGLSPLGSTHNLVVEFSPSEGATWEEVEAALRRGLLRLAAGLAEAALRAPPDRILQLPEVRSGARNVLPAVGAITNLQTQGAFKDTFVYGRSFSASLPTAVDPNELEDGAVVSGQLGHPGLKNPTYLYQNHPVVRALRERDGKDLRFAGLVLSPEPVEQAQKELISAHAARLCSALSWDAAIVTKEG
ncbi:MAG: glycine/sarcosine/betaine reductase component B subunit, partial [Actinomycetota bacterium]